MISKKLFLTERLILSKISTISSKKEVLLSQIISAKYGMLRGQKASTLSHHKRGNKILDILCMCTEAKTVVFRSSIWINYPNWQTLIE